MAEKKATIHMLQWARLRMKSFQLKYSFDWIITSDTRGPKVKPTSKGY